MARVLVLYQHVEIRPMRAAVADHLRVLGFSNTPHQILYYNALNGASTALLHMKFDVIILHTLFLGRRWEPDFEQWRHKLDWISDLPALKVAIPQDEYDRAEILDTWMHQWGISVIFSNFNDTQRQLIYPKMHNQAIFKQCLTGYINDNTAEALAPTLRPIHQRSLDLVYRATHLPFWYGSHGQLKHQIADTVAEYAKAHGLKFDISTAHNSTIWGNRWHEFLASARVVIGCESGSSVLDKRGEIELQIRQFLKQNPNLSFEEVAKQLPEDWDSYRFFALSPRHLEAVITKTCQILVEGEYSGVLVPDKHYISLKPDYSNLDEILEKIQDHEWVQAMVDRAYADIYLSRKYDLQRFAQALESVFPHTESSNENWQWAWLSAWSRMTSIIRPEPRILAYDILNLLGLYQATKNLLRR